jgi:chemotaxis protein methyltransferase CheR
MSLLPLSPPVFAILNALLEERVGLSYTLDDKDILASKVSPRAVEAGFDSLLDYYYFLRHDPSSAAEFAALVNSVVVNETFFFRELAQLQVLVSEHIAPQVAAGNTPRVWSAACSTGEEPLTLAMLLADQGLLERVEIVASDISESALARAQSGQHSRRSLRQVPLPHVAARWLEVHENRISTKPSLRQAVQWKRVNLLDEAAISALGAFDFVLCRNVLIYFKDLTAVRVVKSLVHQLRPHGLLLVGISESLMRFGTGLVCEESSGVFLYRKAAQ